MDRAKAAIEHVIALFNNRPSDIESQVFLAAVPSDSEKQKDPKAGAEFRLIENPDDISEFVGTYAGQRNVYIKAARYKPDSDTPRIVSTSVFCFAWLDLDLVWKPGIVPEELVKRAVSALMSLVNKPSIIVNSGGGIQACWKFLEPMVVGRHEKSRATIERINQELARVFGGDTGQCNPAGGLRLAGTPNMNRYIGKGQKPDCVVILADGPSVDTQALLLELEGSGPRFVPDKKTSGAWKVLSGAVVPGAAAHMKEGKRVGKLDGTAGRATSKTPDEWDAIILGTATMGERSNSITALAGKLVRKGGTASEITDNILERAREAGERLKTSGGRATVPTRSEIRKIVNSVLRTHQRNSAEEGSGGASPGELSPEAEKPGQPDTADGPPDSARNEHRPMPGAGSGTDTAHMDAKRTPVKSFNPTDPAHELRDQVADWYAEENTKGVRVNAGKEFPHNSAGARRLVIDAFAQTLRKNGLDLVRYEQTWRLYDDAERVWSETSAERIGELFTEFWNALTGLEVTAARTRMTVDNIASDPAVVNNAIQWDKPIYGGNHATLLDDGNLLLIAPDGGVSVRPAAADDYLTPAGCPRIAAAWEPAAKAPRTMQALDTLTSCWPAAERASVREALLTWACQVLLPAVRPKPTYKAAVFLGESNTGKTTILDMVRVMLARGDRVRSPVCDMPLDQLDTQFGMQNLRCRRAWLVGEVKTVHTLANDNLFKQLITDESVSIDVKYHDPEQHRLHLTIGVAANHNPNFNDVSDGTLTRLAYFPLKVQFVPADTLDKADPYQAEAIPDLPALFAAERDGILQMLSRHAVALLKAGKFILPQHLIEAVKAGYIGGNRSKEFIDRAVTPKPAAQAWVATRYLRAAFRGMAEQDDGPGAGRRIPVRDIDRMLENMRAKFNAESTLVKYKREVYRAHRGVHLTDEGVQLLQYGLRGDGGQPDRPIADFRSEAEAANCPDVVKPAGVTNLDEARRATRAGPRKDVSGLKNPRA